MVDLSRLLPGPYCTWYMAQLGAEVIKVEDQGKGDYTKVLTPALYKILLAGKTSKTIPFKDEAGKAQLMNLLADADVLVESFRPGAMQAFGLDYQTLKYQFPKLVYASLTGYGQTGPNKGLAGHDINYLAHAGVLEQFINKQGDVAVPGVQVADLVGALNCVVGIQAGLLKAARTGLGSHVDVAMADASMALQVFALHSQHTTGKVPANGKTALTGMLPNYDVYRCADDRFLAIGALEQQFWEGVCDLLGIEKTPVSTNRKAKQMLADLIRSQPLAHWQVVFKETDVCVTPVLSFAEALANPQFRQRGIIDGEDTQAQLACPIIFQE